MIILLQLYDWACREDSPEYRCRTLTFFRLAERSVSSCAQLCDLFNIVWPSRTTGERLGGKVWSSDILNSILQLLYIVGYHQNQVYLCLSITKLSPCHTKLVSVCEANLQVDWDSVSGCPSDSRVSSTCSLVTSWRRRPSCWARTTPRMKVGPIHLLIAIWNLVLKCNMDS